MPHKLRKTRKTRGSRTVGYGVTGQHRGVGQRGGHGKAGRRKHLASWVLRYEPDYFTKKGFHSHRQKRVRSINVGELEELEAKLRAQKKMKVQEGLPFLNLIELGYSKLLGSGRIETSFSIEASSYSKFAARKIEEAGGKLKSPSQITLESKEAPIASHSKAKET